MLARCLCMYVCMYGDVPPPPPCRLHGGPPPCRQGARGRPRRRTLPCPAGRARRACAREPRCAAVQAKCPAVPRAMRARCLCMYGKVPPLPPPLPPARQPLACRQGARGRPRRRTSPCRQGARPGAAVSARGFSIRCKKRDSIGSQPRAVAWMLRGEGGRAGSINSVGVRPGN